MSETTKIWHKGACHCGAVTFEVAAPATVTITDCNCSMCAKTGYQHLIVEAKDFRLFTGESAQTSYRFGTKTANHLFCQTCGTKSFYHPRSHPEGISVNLRCVDQSQFETIKFKPFDGQNWEKNIEGLLET
ncbi:MAG: aldehyde-activating protein [Robiginitomaculum sp.]|nr:MAG: aldehyde-activating protein [Robiginitomaculum sp.]